MKEFQMAKLRPSCMNAIKDIQKRALKDTGNRISLIDASDALAIIYYFPDRPRIPWNSIPEIRRHYKKLAMNRNNGKKMVV
jgi:hypothetical protein